MSPQNLTNVYNQNPTLQGQYTLQQYLDLFGGSSTGTTTPTTNTTTTTPTTNASQGIINQNINQYQSGGGGGGGIQGLDPYSRPQGTPLNPNSFLGKTVQGVKDFGTSVFDKFSGSKVGEGITEGATKFKNIAFTPMMALANMRNPLNPNAQNYNPSLQGQIDMLEGMTGTQITGTSGNLKFTDDQMMIGRDPNSGLAKYGPGSVLSGQNVVSGFGTNDYGQQLQNYIDKMMGYKTRSKFQQAKLDRAIAEKKAHDERVRAEEQRQKDLQTIQERVNRGDSYSDIGKDMYTGKGQAFEKQSGGVSGKGTKNERNYGGRRDGGLMGRGGSRRRSYFDGGIVSLRRR